LDSKVSGRVSSGEWIVADCERWDHDAVEGLIPLMYSSSAAAELKLNEALAQLRRARAYCRSGSVVVARNDYRSLHGAFPVTTATLRDPLNSKPKSGPISVKD
jgi:hypothetical protein